jgi:hypothetical protein
MRHQNPGQDEYQQPQPDGAGTAALDPALLVGAVLLVAQLLQALALICPHGGKAVAGELLHAGGSRWLHGGAGIDGHGEWL